MFVYAFQSSPERRHDEISDANCQQDCNGNAMANEIHDLPQQKIGVSPLAELALFLRRAHHRKFLRNGHSLRVDSVRIEQNDKIKQNDHYVNEIVRSRC